VGKKYNTKIRLCNGGILLLQITKREGRIVSPSPFQTVNAMASRRATCQVRRKNLQGLPITGASAVVIGLFNSRIPKFLAPKRACFTAALAVFDITLYRGIK